MNWKTNPIEERLWLIECFPFEKKQLFYYSMAVELQSHEAKPIKILTHSGAAHQISLQYFQCVELSNQL